MMMLKAVAVVVDSNYNMTLVAVVLDNNSNTVDSLLIDKDMIAGNRIVKQSTALASN